MATHFSLIDTENKKTVRTIRSWIEAPVFYTGKTIGEDLIVTVSRRLPFESRSKSILIL